MSDQFQHVMVLTSINIGLGITHALIGFSTVIDRVSGSRESLRLSWASAMKGGLAYIEANGALTWLQWIAILPASIVGFRSTSLRLHATLAIVFFVWTAVIGFEVLPLLGL